MGYKLIRSAYRDNLTNDYVVDTVADIETLPDINGCPIGSAALCLENSKVYIMNTSGEWKKM